MKEASLRAAGICAILAVMLFCSPSLFADDETDSATEKQPAETEFDEIVVTATRTEEPVFDVPHTVDIIDLREMMNEAMFRTITEAIEDVPGVLAVKTSHGRGSQFIRGFTGQHTLRLIDGVRVNNSVYRGGNVDPYCVERLELVKGPTSVLYGSDAIGGTINFITKSPGEYGDGFLWGGREYVRYSSAEDSQMGRSELWATFNNRFIAESRGWQCLERRNVPTTCVSTFQPRNFTPTLPIFPTVTADAWNRLARRPESCYRDGRVGIVAAGRLDLWTPRDSRRRNGSLPHAASGARFVTSAPDSLSPARSSVPGS